MSFVKRSSSKFFIPARDSRHRTACLALYRALLRSTPQIPVPPYVLASWLPLRDPLRHLIRRAFRRNRADTSPRLVYPALEAGYRALATLRDAATSSSSSSSSSDPKAARDTIVRLLTDHQLERRRTLTAKTTHPPHSRNPPRPSTAPREGTLPLLVRVSPPPPPPSSSNSAISPYAQQYPVGFEYATPHRPLPASALGGTGRRKVPHLDMAGDYVFLRATKPQPALLSRVLTQKIRRRVERAEAAMALAEEGVPEAELEDAWEDIVEGMLSSSSSSSSSSPSRGARERRDGRRWERSGSGNSSSSSRGAGGAEREMTWERWKRVEAGTIEETYSGSMWYHGAIHIQNILSREREDQVARARALRDLVVQERELAEKEKAERKAERRRRWEEATHGSDGTKRATF